MDIIRLLNLDIGNIVLNKAERINNYYYSRITYDNSPLYIQTPKIINTKDMDNLKNTNPFIEAMFNNENYDKLLALDDYILKETKNNWENWTGRGIPEDKMDEMYTRITKPTKENKSPKLKMKIPMKKENILCKVFDQKKIEFNLKELKKDKDIICILHFRGIKFNETNFYCDFYINQIKVFNTSIIDFSIIQECCIDEEEINEKDIIDDYEVNNKVLDDKIKVLTDQKNEDEQLVNSITQRINTINEEIQKLEKNKMYY
jgi:hypothetical protein